MWRFAWPSVRPAHLARSQAVYHMVARSAISRAVYGKKKSTENSLRLRDSTPSCRVLVGVKENPPELDTGADGWVPRRGPVFFGDWLPNRAQIGPGLDPSRARIGLEAGLPRARLGPAARPARGARLGDVAVRGFPAASPAARPAPSARRGTGAVRRARVVPRRRATYRLRTRAYSTDYITDT